MRASSASIVKTFEHVLCLRPTMYLVMRILDWHSARLAKYFVAPNIPATIPALRVLRGGRLGRGNRYYDRRVTSRCALRWQPRARQDVSPNDRIRPCRWRTPHAMRHLRHGRE